MQLGFGTVGKVFGVIVNLVIIGFFIFNTAVYNYSFGRLLFFIGQATVRRDVTDEEVIAEVTGGTAGGE